MRSGPPQEGSEPAGPMAADGELAATAAAVSGLPEDAMGAGNQWPADLSGLDDVARQRDEYLDTLRRVQADFDNFRKRVERQQREMTDNAATSLAKKLLPVLDTAELALAHGGGQDVKQIEAALFDVLSKEGLDRIVAEGQPFDPEVHDAVAHEPVEGDGAPARPEVSEVLRSGYRWKGRVLRPAMVKVRG